MISHYLGSAMTLLLLQNPASSVTDCIINFVSRKLAGSDDVDP